MTACESNWSGSPPERGSPGASQSSMTMAVASAERAGGSQSDGRRRPSDGLRVSTTAARRRVGAWCRATRSRRNRAISSGSPPCSSMSFVMSSQILPGPP